MPYAPLVHEPEQIRAWVRQYLICSARVVVAIYESEVVAFLAASEDRVASWIDHLYVLPGFENQRVGTKLLLDAHAVLRRPIRLYTFQQNDGARRFYERHGYRIVSLSDGRNNEERCPDALYELGSDADGRQLERQASKSEAPPHPMQLNQVTLPAVDVEKSVAFYRGLGLRLIVSALPRYARLECPVGGATFSLHQVPKRPEPSDAVVYFECENLDVRVSQLQASGYIFNQEPKDESWLWREARLFDPSGNVICLYWAGENRRNPPWRLS